MSQLGYLLGTYGTRFLAAYAVGLRIAVIGFAIGFVLGIVLTVARISPVQPLRTAATVWVEIFRNVPVLCLLIFIVYALPDVGLTIDYEPSVVTALALVSSAFACDNLRTGINAIEAGQIEAARALGLRFLQIVATIVLPQSLRGVVQPMVTLFISVVISSSTGALVPMAHSELTGLVATINNAEALGVHDEDEQAQHQQIDFAGPYYTSRQAILVKKSNTDITGTGDLSGKKVGVQKGSTGPQVVAEVAPKASVQEFQTNDDITQALRQGRIDAYVVDETLLLGNVAKNPNDFKIVGEPFGAEDPYGIGLPKGSDAAAFVNAWLKTIEEDGTWAKLWQVSIGERTGQSESPEPPAIKE